MSIQSLIGEGIGFTPTSTSFIITDGLSVSAFSAGEHGTGPGLLLLLFPSTGSVDPWSIVPDVQIADWSGITDFSVITQNQGLLLALFSNNDATNWISIDDSDSNSWTTIIDSPGGWVEIIGD